MGCERVAGSLPSWVTPWLGTFAPRAKPARPARPAPRDLRALASRAAHDLRPPRTVSAHAPHAPVASRPRGVPPAGTACGDDPSRKPRRGALPARPLARSACVGDGRPARAASPRPSSTRRPASRLTSRKPPSPCAKPTCKPSRRKSPTLGVRALREGACWKRAPTSLLQAPLRDVDLRPSARRQPARSRASRSRASRLAATRGTAR